MEEQGHKATDQRDREPGTDIQMKRGRPNMRGKGERDYRNGETWALGK